MSTKRGRGAGRGRGRKPKVPIVKETVSTKDTGEDSDASDVIQPSQKSKIVFTKTVPLKKRKSTLLDDVEG